MTEKERTFKIEKIEKYNSEIKSLEKWELWHKIAGITCGIMAIYFMIALGFSETDKQFWADLGVAALNTGSSILNFSLLFSKLSEKTVRESLVKKYEDDLEFDEMEYKNVRY